MKNVEIANLFNEIADFLEVKDENPFRIRAYRRAAQAVEGLAEDIAAIAERGELLDVPGIGKDLAGKIKEIVETGKLALLEELKAKIPEGLLAMVRLPGLGPKRARLIHDELKIQDLDALAVAAREGLYFKLESVIARDYLALLPDGTYQFVACSDFSAWETDTGKWQFSDGSGGVLVSAWQTEVDYADIDGGFFTVRVASRQDFLRLPELRSGLEQFLQTKSGNHFKFSENPGLADWLGIVPVPGRDQFTRAEVNAGIAALDRALAGARPLSMPFRICSEGEFTYVISSDTGERSLLLMNEARARDRIRRYGRGHMVPARITRTEFRNMRKEPAAAPE